jgi:CheY-like chemotaxis protein
MSKIILVADDSTTMQQVAEITFKATEFTYVGARSVDEAVEKARAQKPALVLADAVMQGKSGYDLCQAIKSDGKLGDVPVVILCGNSAAFDAAKGAQVGADGSLSKPWDTQVMLEKVAEFIDKAAGGVARPGAAAPITSASTQPSAGAVPPPKPLPATTPIPVAAKPPEPKPAPPRSATIMGMPTIKFPAGQGPGAPAEPAKPPAPAMTAKPPATPVTPPPPVSSGPSMASSSGSMAATSAGGNHGSVGRPPMISGTPTKRSALVERTLAKMAARLAEATGLQPGSPELIALLKLSTEVVERVVWEVVPELAEQIIRENLQELTARKGN